MASIKWFMVLGILILASSIAFSFLPTPPDTGYGYSHPLSSSDGGSPPAKVNLTVQVLCNGTIITVTSLKGTPLNASIMVATTDFIYYLGETGEDGVVVLPYGQVPCGATSVEVLAHPKVGNYEYKRIDMAFDCPDNCAGCPNGQVSYQDRCVQCVSDSDCPAGTACAGNSCTQPGGTGNQTPVGPVCTPPGCCTQDDQCGAGKFCEISPTAASGKCSPIVCGSVVNHQLVPFECGSEDGCQSCPKPKVCEQNTCHLYGIQCPVTSATVGDTVTCTETKDGAPCNQCNGTFVGPNGGSTPFTTDGDGHFTLNLSQVGTYRIFPSGNPSAGASVLANASPVQTGGAPQGGQPSGGSSIWLFLIFILVIILAGGLVYWVFIKGPKKK